jgi:Tol biopolymer transport system component
MDSDGTNKTTLTRNSKRFAYHSDLQWSPSNDKIIYVEDDRDNSTSNIWVMNIDGSEQTKIGHGIAPNWSPDGDKILFTELIDDKFAISVVIIDEDVLSASSTTVEHTPESTHEETPGFSTTIAVFTLLMLFKNMTRRH